MHSLLAVPLEAVTVTVPVTVLVDGVTAKPTTKVSPSLVLYWLLLKDTMLGSSAD